MTRGRMIDIGSTELHVVERGSGPALMVLHGGPGLDHMSFGRYLDSLAEHYRLLFVDQRGHGRSAPSDAGTWRLEQLAEDVAGLARALKLDQYAVFGHSFGAFVALQHAVDNTGTNIPTILCGGVPSTAYFESIEKELADFQPLALREQTLAAMESQLADLSPPQAHAAINSQLPFMFADPADPRIAEYERETARMVCSPQAMKHFVGNDYGGIEVEHRLDGVTGPILVLTGRYDRICSVAAAESIAATAPRAELIIFERSGHFPFVEENEALLVEVSRFLAEHLVP